MINKKIEREVIRKIDTIELMEDLDICFKYFGNEIRIVCPFHAGADGYNLSININKKVFKCFSNSCEQNGYNLVDLVMRLKRCNERDTVIRYMANLAGISIDYLGRNVKEVNNTKKGLAFKENTLQYIRELNSIKEKGNAYFKERQARTWHKELLQCRYAMNYLTKERGLTEGDIEDFYLGFDSNGKEIIFPVYSTEGKIKSVIKRTLSEEKAEISGKYRVFGTKSECLYGLKELFNKGFDISKLILVEGAFDAIALQRIGFSAVAVLGDSITKYQIKILNRLLPKEIVLCLDCDSVVKADDPGKEGMLRMINQFSKAGFDLDNISVIQLTGFQDPDEVPEAEFRQMYERRIPALYFYLTQQIR